MVNIDGRVATHGIFARFDGNHIRLYAVSHLKRQFRSRGVVEHVPQPEHQFVHSLGELGYWESHLSALIAAEVKREVVVEGVCHCGRTINHEHHVMTDTCARGIDTTCVIQFGKEIRSLVHLVTIDERLRVEIAESRRPDGVERKFASAIERHTTANAVHLALSVGTVGKYQNLRLSVAVCNILWNDKLKGELAVLHGIRSRINRARTVLVYESLLGTVSRRVLQTAHDGFLSTLDYGREGSVEGGVIHASRHIHLVSRPEHRQV